MNIIIIGGATGGMSAALQERRLDKNAYIILIEQGDCLGYANSGLPSSVGDVIKTDTIFKH
jgi:NADPH-dependent 2,4-dienoyl-CoA reductase/sulfur reductase-like enzyme